MSNASVQLLTAAAVWLPVAGFVLLGLGGPRLRRVAGGLATGLLLLAALAAFLLWLRFWPQGQPGLVIRLRWIALPQYFVFHLGAQMDAASTLLLAIVTLCAVLVSVFSLRYMAHDEGRHRYYAWLCLFAAAMIGLVLAPNLLQTFVCWELVGASSYLLIGYWYVRPDAQHASLKAFLVNRVGDALLLAGILLFVVVSSSARIPDFLRLVPLQFLRNGLPDWVRILPDAGYALLTAAGLLLVLGAAAKSAQLPYSGWLPDAMAGPTPVSALIHAATMVAAGVFVLYRASLVLTPNAQFALAVMGAATALYGAVGAIAQFDIKRVLAYSTVSQLGYMFLALGMGMPHLAVFHLATHAFFKCGLFLCAAAVIHHMHDAHPTYNAQDMRTMGGLRHQLPLVFVAYAVCAAALVGLPLTSGFMSKDAILYAVTVWQPAHGAWGWAVLACAFLTVALTAGYMTRQFILVFLDAPRHGVPDPVQPARHPVSWQFAVPLGLLAVLAMAWPLGLLGIPQRLSYARATDSALGAGWGLVAAVLLLVGAGAGVAVLTYRRYRYVEATIPMVLWRRLSHEGLYLSGLYRFLAALGLRLARLLRRLERVLIEGLIYLLTKTLASNRSNVNLAQLADWLDRRAVDGLVRSTGSAAVSGGAGVAQLQSGRVQQYLVWALFAMLLLAAVVLFAYLGLRHE